MVCYDRTIFGQDTIIWKSGNWRCKKNLNIEKITFEVFQMNFFAMYITNQKLSFDIFTVGNLQMYRSVIYSRYSSSSSSLNQMSVWMSCAWFHMEQHLPHRAVVHWQAAQNYVYYHPGFVQLVSEQRLCVVNAAPCEIMHVMEITADYRIGFTDKMRIKYRMRHIVQP